MISTMTTVKHDVLTGSAWTAISQPYKSNRAGLWSDRCSGPSGASMVQTLTIQYGQLVRYPAGPQVPSAAGADTARWLDGAAGPTVRCYINRSNWMLPVQFCRSQSGPTSAYGDEFQSTRTTTLDAFISDNRIRQ